MRIERRRQTERSKSSQTADMSPTYLPTDYYMRRPIDIGSPIVGGGGGGGVLIHQNGDGEFIHTRERASSSLSSSAAAAASSAMIVVPRGLFLRLPWMVGR